MPSNFVYSLYDVRCLMLTKVSLIMEWECFEVFNIARSRFGCIWSRHEPDRPDPNSFTGLDLADVIYFPVNPDLTMCSC